MSKKKQGNQQKNKTALFKEIVGVFNHNPKKLYNYKQLAADVGVHPANHTQEIQGAVGRLRQAPAV